MTNDKEEDIVETIARELGTLRDKDHNVVRVAVVRLMRARPELTLGDLRRCTAELSGETVVRIDLGGLHHANSGRSLDPEELGLVSATPGGYAGNNVRPFSVSDVVDGVLRLEC